MGYMTSYELSVETEAYKEDFLIREIRDNSEDAAYAIDEFGQCGNDTKWYEHDDELVEVSKKYPEAVFCLEGKGEESGDMWQTYYKDGKLQLCEAKITFDEYDKSKLKEPEK